MLQKFTAETLQGALDLFNTWALDHTNYDIYTVLADGTGFSVVIFVRI